MTATKLTPKMIRSGMRVLLTRRELHERSPREYVLLARITWVDPYDATKDAVYFGYVPENRAKFGSWGCQTLRGTPRPFGLQGVELVAPGKGA